MIKIIKAKKFSCNDNKWTDNLTLNTKNKANYIMNIYYINK